MGPLDRWVKESVVKHLTRIESGLDSDTLVIMSEIRPGVDRAVRDALATLESSGKEKLTIILDTPGGVVEVVERMVNVIRHRYKHISFLIPDRAMSAGTVFALSGNQVYMDEFSVLGPIDPQVVKGDRLVPALSYILMWERLRELAGSGTFTNADFVLLDKLDLAELHQFHEAAELSKELIKNWLPKHKLAGWTQRETSGEPVTDKDRESIAVKVAEALSDVERWHSHSRGIDRKILSGELGLRIDDLSALSVAKDVKESFDLLQDYMWRHNSTSLVFTRDYF